MSRSSTFRLRATLLTTLLCASGCTRSAPGTDTPLTVTGYVEADLVYVAAPAAGWLTSHVSEGDRVEIGDLLFELDTELQQARLDQATNRLRQAEAQSRDLTTGARAPEIEALQSRLAEARASLELARLTRRRLVELADQGVVAQEAADRSIANLEATQARVEAIERDIEVARLGGREATRDAAAAGVDVRAQELREAQWSLSQRQISARVAGRVEQLIHREGELVPTSAPVLALLTEGSLEVRFFLPEAELGRAQPGTRVSVRSDGGAERTARIHFVAGEPEFTPPVIYSNESRSHLVFLVRARLEDPTGVRPGQPVDVIVP